jgi:hypothetical protein
MIRPRPDQNFFHNVLVKTIRGKVLEKPSIRETERGYFLERFQGCFIWKAL